ncbi:MAG: hypothetical protein V1855_04835 [bacterium]
MNKKLRICTIILLLSNPLLAEKTNGQKNITTKSSQATQTDKVKESTYEKMLKQLKKVKNKNEYYKTHLFIAKKLYNGTDEERDLAQALDHCCTAMEGVHTKKAAKKLFYKIVTELLMVLANEPNEITLKLDTQELKDLIKKMVADELEEKVYKKCQTAPPPGMYI